MKWRPWPSLFHCAEILPLARTGNASGRSMAHGFQQYRREVAVETSFVLLMSELNHESVGMGISKHYSSRGVSYV
jgi:hypothetical protein